MKSVNITKLNKVIFDVIAKSDDPKMFFAKFKKTAEYKTISTSVKEELEDLYGKAKKVKEALKCYSKALRREKTNTTALLGQLKCQIFDEKLDEVEKQLELLSETVPAITTNPVQTFVFLNHTFFYVLHVMRVNVGCKKTGTQMNND